MKAIAASGYQGYVAHDSCPQEIRLSHWKGRRSLRCIEFCRSSLHFYFRGIHARPNVPPAHSASGKKSCGLSLYILRSWCCSGSLASASWRQLNPFDLVVLLSLSNTVQNAIIGDDNSVSGGIIGAITPAFRQLAGCPGALWFAAYEPYAQWHGARVDSNGRVDVHALKRELLH